MDAFKINEGADTATIADGDLMSFSGRIQNAGGSTMMAADADSQFRFALQMQGHGIYQILLMLVPLDIQQLVRVI